MKRPPAEARADRLRGVLLGTAVGDALGLPREGLSPRRAARLFGGPPLRHRLLGERGMVSDDTEHAALVGLALLRGGAEPGAFAAALARGLRRWLLALPAGVGWATLRAVGKLCLGVSPERSGVFSAGNGPAMRAALLGACLHQPGDAEALRALVRASTRITHTDPKAEAGALLVARAAALGARAPGPLDAAATLHALQAGALEPEWRAMLAQVESHLHRGSEADVFAASLGFNQGVSGYILHTVPAALYCWLRHPEDFGAAVAAVIRLGGDTDSTAAIVGGLAGATLGAHAIPGPWVDGIRDWPLSTAWLRQLGDLLARRFPTEGAGPRGPGAPPALPFLATLLRNAFFMAVVLGHGVRRLLPPY